jgi:hypothetical protein
MRSRRVQHTSRNKESHNGGGGAVIILLWCGEGIKPSDNFLSLLISGMTRSVVESDQC